MMRGAARGLGDDPSIPYGVAGDVFIAMKVVGDAGNRKKERRGVKGVVMVVAEGRREGGVRKSMMMV